MTVWRASQRSHPNRFTDRFIQSDGQTPSSPSKCLANSFRRLDGRRILLEPGSVLNLRLVLKTRWEGTAWQRRSSTAQGRRPPMVATPLGRLDPSAWRSAPALEPSEGEQDECYDERTDCVLDGDVREPALNAGKNEGRPPAGTNQYMAAKARDLSRDPLPNPPQKRNASVLRDSAE